MYYDYKTRYAANPVFDFLRKDSVEHRVTMFFNPFYSRPLAQDGANESQLLGALSSEWLQNQFQFYNVQSCDIIQMSRRPVLEENYREEFTPKNGLPSFARFWQLANTRYLIAQRGFEQLLNLQFDPTGRRFRNLTNFAYRPKPSIPQPRSINDLTWEFDPNGPFSIIEFTGALPRHGLYTAWQPTADEAALKMLNSPDFDPARQVIVNADSGITASSSTNQPGKTTLVSYHPKKIELTADATAPSILLWNDRWSQNWKAYLDGQPVPLLRCNYIMRGVQVPAGSHKIEMRYAQPAQALWISFATMAIGIGLCFFLAVDSRRTRA
jgi:hypothetical protein